MSVTSIMDRADHESRDLVLALANSPRAVRFGEKVFLGSLGFDMTDPVVRRSLIDMNREGLIRLSRADLVGAMDPAMVAASELLDPTPYGRPAEYHFVDPTYRGR